MDSKFSLSLIFKKNYLKTKRLIPLFFKWSSKHKSSVHQLRTEIAATVIGDSLHSTVRQGNITVRNKGPVITLAHGKRAISNNSYRIVMSFPSVNFVRVAGRT